jgi:hypothetical protein
VITQAQQLTRRAILDWVCVEYGNKEPKPKVRSPIDLDSDGFVAELKKVQRQGKAVHGGGLRGESVRSLEPTGFVGGRHRLPSASKQVPS